MGAEDDDRLGYLGVQRAHDVLAGHAVQGDVLVPHDSVGGELRLEIVGTRLAGGSSGDSVAQGYLIGNRVAPFSRQVIDSTLYAVGSFRIRCLVDAVDDIRASGLYSSEEIDRLTLQLFDEETEKFKVLQVIREKGSISVSELEQLLDGGKISPFNLYKDIYAIL